MKFYCFLILFNVQTIIAHGQGINSIVDHSTNPGEVLVEFDTRSINLEGHYFINKEWQKADIYFRSGSTLTKIDARFDLEFDLLEINMKGEIKVVPLYKLKKFVLYNNRGSSENYVNCESYNYEDGTPLTGVCEILDSSYYGMIKKFEYEIKEATYIPTHDMGSKSPEIIVKGDIFLTKESTSYPLIKKKNKLLELYKPWGDSIKVYIKKNKINIKKKEDLLQLLTYINELN